MSNIIHPSMDNGVVLNSATQTLKQRFIPNLGGIFYNNTNSNNNLSHMTQSSSTHQQVISQLKFIANIRKGDKINVRHMYVQPESILTRIDRTLFNIDNRRNAMTFLETTIKRGFEVISLHKQSSSYPIMYVKNVISPNGSVEAIASQSGGNPRNYSYSPSVCSSSTSPSERILSGQDEPKSDDNDITHCVNETPQLTYNETICMNVKEDITRALVGLVNLKATYADDVMFCCHMDTLIEDTIARLQNL